MPATNQYKFRKACGIGDLKTVENLLEQPDVNLNHEDMFHVTPFSLACNGGNVDMIKLFLNRCEIDMSIKGNSLGQFLCAASGRWRDSIIQILLTEFSDLINQLDVMGLAPLHHACNGNKEAAVKALLEHNANVNLISHNGTRPIQMVCSFKSRAVSELLLAHNDIIVEAQLFDSLERHQHEYRIGLDKFIKNYLFSLEKATSNFRTNNPRGIFDFPMDEERNYDNNGSLLGYYVLRYLVRCCEVNERSQLANDINIHLSIELLLNIPSVKALVITNATSTELPANYLRLGNRQFAGQTNELLRLAQSMGNETIAARLLDIPAIREAAEANNFYEGEHGVNLAEVAHDRESSMRALTPEEQESVQRVEEEYKATIQEQGGVSEVIEQLKETLKAKYLADHASRTITLNDVDYPIPFEWNELQQFIQEHGCTREQQEKIAQVYYQNPYHTAYRYLSKPNRWMAEDAGWVYISDDRQERWSTFEEYLPLIAYLWTAANDEAHPPAEANVSVADRVDLFIRQIVLINRAHNWDKYRPVLNEAGEVQFDENNNLIQEEYDDGKGDKPSCYSGVKKRLFQALLHHPLYTPLDKSIAKQFVNGAIHDYYQGLLLDYGLEQLHQLQQAVNDYFIFGEGVPEPEEEEEDDVEVNTYLEHKGLVNALVLPEDYGQEIKEALTIHFGEKRADAFSPVVDGLLSQDGAIANDFLRLYQSAGLDKLLDLVIKLHPLRAIVDEVVVHYLLEMAQSETKDDYLAFNELLHDVQENGVGGIWSAIKDRVKEQYLALDGIEANDAGWNRLLGVVKAMALSQEAQGIIQGRIQETVKQSPGYQAYRQQGGEGGSSASPFFADVEVQQPVLISHVNAALTECKKKNSLSPEDIEQIEMMVARWEALDNDTLRAQTIARFLEDEDNSWTRGTFERALSFHLYNKKLYGEGDVQGLGLRVMQSKIFNGLASGNIARDTAPLLAQALRAEFAVAAPVAAPMQERGAGLV